MRHKEDENGGVVDGVTNTFDASTALPFTVPTDVAAAQEHRTAVDRHAGVLRSVGAGDRRSVLDARGGGGARLLAADRPIRRRA